MSDDVARLRALVDRLAGGLNGSDDPGCLAATLGSISRSDTAIDAFDIVVPDWPGLQIRLRCWSDDRPTGVLDVTFETSALHARDAVAALGPLHEVVRMHRGPRTLAAVPRSGRLADTAIYVDLDGDVVVGLMLRRDPH